MPCSTPGTNSASRCAAFCLTAPVLLGMQPAVSSDDTLPVLDGPHRRPKASKDSNKLSRGTSVEADLHCRSTRTSVHCGTGARPKEVQARLGKHPSAVSNRQKALSAKTSSDLLHCKLGELAAPARARGPAARASQA